MKILEKFIEKHGDEGRFKIQFIIPPAVMVILFLLYGCSSGKALQRQTSNATGQPMYSFSIYIQHLPGERITEAMSDIADASPNCRILEINQAQPVTILQTAANDVVVKISATADAIRWLSHRLVDFGGAIQIVRE